MQATTITGKTPTGAAFTLSQFNLEWHRNGEVGPISVPLHADAPLSEIAKEIETAGRLSDDTRRCWINH